MNRAFQIVFRTYIGGTTPMPEIIEIYGDLLTKDEIKELLLCSGDEDKFKEVLSTVTPYAPRTSGYFAETSWSEEDIENVLDLADIPLTKENLSTFYDAIDEDNLIGAMVNSGWEYLHDIRDELDNENKFNYDKED